jgi:hypothetical protein
MTVRKMRGRCVLARTCIGPLLLSYGKNYSYGARSAPRNRLGLRHIDAGLSGFAAALVECFSIHALKPRANLLACAIWQKIDRIVVGFLGFLHESYSIANLEQPREATFQSGAGKILARRGHATGSVARMRPWRLLPRGSAR